MANAQAHIAITQATSAFGGLAVKAMATIKATESFHDAMVKITNDDGSCLKENKS